MCRRCARFAGRNRELSTDCRHTRKALSLPCFPLLDVPRVCLILDRAPCPANSGGAPQLFPHSGKCGSIAVCSIVAFSLSWHPVAPIDAIHDFCTALFKPAFGIRLRQRKSSGLWGALARTSISLGRLLRLRISKGLNCKVWEGCPIQALI